MGLMDFMQKPGVQEGLMGLFTGLQGVGRTGYFDDGGHFGKMNEQMEQAKRQQAMQGLMGGMDLNPMQQQLLSALPPEAAMGLMAEQAFPDPGNPYARYKVVPGVGLVDLGGEGGPAVSIKGERQPNAMEQKIAMLESTGVDTATARGIAAGRYVTSRDPISGHAQIVDKASGQVVGSGEAAERVAQVEEGTSVPDDVDYTSALGGEGFVAGIGNTIADAIGMDLPAPQAERAAQALTNLQVRTQTTLQDAVPGRPSNYLMEELKKLTVEPGSLFQGEQRSVERLGQTRDLIRRAIEENQQILANAGDFKPEQVSKARQKIIEMQSLLRDYETVLGAMGPKEEAPRITSPDQLEGLPSGSVFIAPDGSRRIKP